MVDMELRNHHTPQELLFSCLRFVGRDEHGHPDPSLPPIPYSDDIDDRDPIGFEFPPDRRFSSGPNQVWNSVAAIASILAEQNSYQIEHQRVLVLLRDILDAPDADAHRLAIVAATEYRYAWAHQDEVN